MVSIWEFVKSVWQKKRVKMTNFLKVAGQMEKSFFRMAGKMLKINFSFFKKRIAGLKFFILTTRQTRVDAIKFFDFVLVCWKRLKFSFYLVPGVEKLFFNRPANSSEFVKFYIAGGYDNFLKILIFMEVYPEIFLN